MNQPRPPAGDGATLPREGRSWPELAQALRDFTVADRMTALGWSVGRIREPRGIHPMLTPVHAPIIDEYLADLARSVDEARGVASPSPTRAVY